MTSWIRSAACASSLALAISCGSNAGGGVAPGGSGGTHSSSMVLAPDGTTLYVVNPEADSVSVLDVAGRTLSAQILLADAVPAPDPTGAFAPAVMPRSVAISKDGSTLYVTGERSSALYFIDAATKQVTRTVHVGSEPVGVVSSPDGASIYVACSQDSTVVRVDATTGKVEATATVAAEPWALGWSNDGTTLLVTQFMGPGVTALDPRAMSVLDTWAVPDMAPRGNRLLSHGQVRGLYDVAARPSTGEVWVAHALLATDTAQPALDFESTAFPALSVLHDDGKYEQTLTTDASDVAGVDGAFADVVSGPHAVAFTHDGDFALMVAANSEDILIVDANTKVESGLVRPLPGFMPDGIVVSADDQFAYVDERQSGDVAVLRLARTGNKLSASVDGATIPLWTSDPMPETLRLGDRLFNSANSTEFPITTDHWISCATCHMEGRSDAVTWKFSQGPRDTPTNAGGMLGTGFLFRTADRTKVEDYFHTINVEQGGRFDATDQATLLSALADYVNFGLPLPIPPTTNATLVSQGQALFQSSGCPSCHSGERFTDSGGGNPTLDLGGVILLHDIGTCVTSGSFPDVAHQDVDGNPRAACDFDTPSLNGVASTPPYLHDGSAETLRDAVLEMPNAPTAPTELDALVEYLKSL